MIRLRTTTIPVMIASFVTGALAAVLAVVIVMDHASTDDSLRAVGASRLERSIDTPRLSSGDPPPAIVPGASIGDPGSNTSGNGSRVAGESTSAEMRSAVAELRRRNLLVPVVGVEVASLRSTFDDSRSAGRVHEAMDILAPRNTAVRAVSDGTVAKLFRSDAGGLTIYEFDPAERFAFYYAHLERYAAGLREGDRIVRGQTIGFVGTSGNAPRDTPHLHFAIFKLGPERRWWQGEAIDPFEIWKP